MRVFEMRKLETALFAGVGLVLVAVFWVMDRVEL